MQLEPFQGLTPFVIPFFEAGDDRLAEVRYQRVDLLLPHGLQVRPGCDHEVGGTRECGQTVALYRRAATGLQPVVAHVLY